jgi:hypothetical protein
MVQTLELILSTFVPCGNNYVMKILYPARLLYIQPIDVFTFTDRHTSFSTQEDHPCFLMMVRSISSFIHSVIHIHSMDPYMTRKPVDREIVTVNKTSHVNNIFTN